MKQRSFASLSFEAKKKPTWRARFLGEMDKAVPWPELLALIEPGYPTAGRRRQLRVENGHSKQQIRL